LDELLNHEDDPVIAEEERSANRQSLNDEVRLLDLDSDMQLMACGAGNHTSSESELAVDVVLAIIFTPAWLTILRYILIIIQAYTCR